MENKIKFCRKCGKKLNAEAKFCRYCGASAAASTDNAYGAVAEDNSACKLRDTGLSENTERIEAAAAGGELSLGEFDFIKEALSSDTYREASNASRAVTGSGKKLPRAGAKLYKAGETVRDIKNIGVIPSPFKAVLSGIPAFVKGSFGILKSPGKIVLTLALAAVWIVLGRLRDSQEAAVKILSWLFYADGGLDRSMLGNLGTILGRGTVAAALGSLFTGGLAATLKGIADIFKKPADGSKGSIFAFAAGLVLSAAFFFLYTGTDTLSAGSSMPGIAGALFALQAIGGRRGYFYCLARSFTAVKKNKERTLRTGRLKSMLTGMAVGFGSLAAVVCIL